MYRTPYQIVVLVTSLYQSGRFLVLNFAVYAVQYLLLYCPIRPSLCWLSSRTMPCLGVWCITSRAKKQSYLSYGDFAQRYVALYLNSDMCLSQVGSDWLEGFVLDGSEVSQSSSFSELSREADLSSSCT